MNVVAKRTRVNGRTRALLPSDAHSPSERPFHEIGTWASVRIVT